MTIQGWIIYGFRHHWNKNTETNHRAQIRVLKMPAQVNVHKCFPPVWLVCSAPSSLPVSAASEHQGCCPGQTETASPAQVHAQVKPYKPAGHKKVRAESTCSCSAVNDVRALLAGFGWQSWSDGRAPSRVSPVPFKKYTCHFKPHLNSSDRILFV